VVSSNRTTIEQFLLQPIWDSLRGFDRSLHPRPIQSATRRPTIPRARLSQESLDRLIAECAPGQIEDVYGLSPMQAGMFFHTLYDYASSRVVYLDQAVYEIDEDLERSGISIVPGS